MSTTEQDGHLPDARLGKIRYGKDDDLEELADEWLSRGVGDNKRSKERDCEKMLYEFGLIDETELYDPTNDWDTHDSAYAVAVQPGDIDGIESDICASDENIRARNSRLLERQMLMRHVNDVDGWGSPMEDIPILGANDGPRKTCTRCGKSKGLSFFSPRAGRKAALQSWCKQCRKEVESQKRKNSK